MFQGLLFDISKPSFQIALKNFMFDAKIPKKSPAQIHISSKVLLVTQILKV